MSAAITRTDERPSFGLLRDPLRDIARGGLAGLLTGILVAGVGGRIVMRAAALLVPDAAGRLTENGNRIGEITLSGTLGLVVAGGLFFGLAGAVLWVVVSPWIPGGRWTRLLLAMPVAVCLSGVLLIKARNPDFAILRHDVTTVVLLVALVALAGLAIAGFDSWLDARLPVASASGWADASYLALSVAGAALIFPVVLGLYLGEERLLGLALVGVGVATLVRWTFRFRGLSSPAWLIIAGRGSLLVAVVFGALALAPDLASALGAS
jgi:hypothetical protein